MMQSGSELPELPVIWEQWGDHNYAIQRPKIVDFPLPQSPPVLESSSSDVCLDLPEDNNMDFVPLKDITAPQLELQGGITEDKLTNVQHQLETYLVELGKQKRTLRSMSKSLFPLEEFPESRITKSSQGGGGSSGNISAEVQAESVSIDNDKQIQTKTNCKRKAPRKRNNKWGHRSSSRKNKKKNAFDESEMETEPLNVEVNEVVEYTVIPKQKVVKEEYFKKEDINAQKFRTFVGKYCDPITDASVTGLSKFIKERSKEAEDPFEIPSFESLSINEVKTEPIVTRKIFSLRSHEKSVSLSHYVLQGQSDTVCKRSLPVTRMSLRSTSTNNPVIIEPSKFINKENRHEAKVMPPLKNMKSKVETLAKYDVALDEIKETERNLKSLRKENDLKLEKMFKISEKARERALVAEKVRKLDLQVIQVYQTINAMKKANKGQQPSVQLMETKSSAMKILEARKQTLTKLDALDEEISNASRSRR